MISSYSISRQLAVLAMMLAGQAAQAVSLSSQGTGQVLLYPLYKTFGGSVTQISVVNGEDRAKALRVQFNEALNGRPVLTLNLYLGAHDTWYGSVFAASNQGPANLVTDDASCLFPDFRDNPAAPRLPDGRSYIPFDKSNYQDDGGFRDFSRTLDGTVTVFELGSVLPGSTLADALSVDPNGAGIAPKSCNYLAQAWANGVWTSNTSAGLVNPTGGLTGSANLIDVAEGKLFAYDATALDDFRIDPLDSPQGTKASVVMHTRPTDPHPTLADAISDPVQQIASADVTLRRHMIHVDYPASRAIDAVTATLMADTIRNDYIFNYDDGITTDWIVAMPTARFYTDQDIVGPTAIPPFLLPFSNIPYHPSCLGITSLAYFRNGEQNLGQIFNYEWCYSTQEISISPPTEFSGSGFHGRHDYLLEQAGWQQWDLGGRTLLSNYKASMRPANDGTIFDGLPVIGFAKFNFAAANAAGAAANYSGRSDHRRTVHCTNSAGKCD